MDLEVRSRRHTSSDQSFVPVPDRRLRSASPITGNSFAFPPPDAFMADGESTQQHDLAEIPQCQSVAQPAEHHERDDVARQRRSIEGTVTALVELLVAVSAPEPTIALCCQVGRSVTAAELQPMQSIAI